VNSGKSKELFCQIWGLFKTLAGDCSDGGEKNSEEGDTIILEKKKSSKKRRFKRKKNYKPSGDLELGGKKAREKNRGGFCGENSGQ